VERRHRGVAALAIVVIIAAGCVLLGGCSAMTGTSNGGSNTCTITAEVTPASATADHALSAPGNQAQFTASSTVTGNCPLIADMLGSWSTSDAANTTVTANPQNPLQSTATCRGATANAATISYSGTVRGHAFASATLSCK
jgi:hypothetical protein